LSIPQASYLTFVLVPESI